jgi:MFS family permease
MSSPRESPGRAVAGAMALALAMGIGRFAYTALLPAAQRGVPFGDAAAGAIAATNLVGYLAGVMVARGTLPERRDRVLRAGLALSVLATLGTALAGSVGAWVVVRGAAGVASGLVFVLASAAVLEAAAGVSAASVLYAGVGAGIALSGIVAALPLPGWRAPWLVLGAAAAGLAVPGWRALEARPHPPLQGAGATRPASTGLSFGRLAFAYSLEGLGYIVSGTFAVAAAQRLPQVAPFAAWVWVLAGLAAAPSAALWNALGTRVGERTALAVAMGVQAAGMALPALSPTPAAALAGAALFGGTFIGITTLTMAAARRLAPGHAVRIIGTLTALYGVGQALGPLLAGLATDRLGDSRPAVTGASVAVAIGALALARRAPRT